ncbi:PREDICTED: protein trichome birefringence-like 14 [Nelumbo nucifera]|uniref:Protein trichome birefringence-like 14 n=2 Tax=Nelumbo nucifera TaxID=4432 RepID=A0A1U8PY20_NELNU|nr:PREDICTED: protein trichome birefringence-like 14 [Nelumbo nucifera]XP_019051428.1 PREDICTED: protein trichome birefringence-like 14 [Nelumbo nucifera]DAD49025.1 TPA_asm: hypothetical protein HUJ06_018962 [Nelumbo nucifera]
MKRWLYGLKGKQLSLTLVAMACTTILIWAWEKTPLLTTLLPPQSLLSIPSSEILMGTPLVSATSSNSDVYVKEDLSYAEPNKETITEHGEQSFSVVAPTNMNSPEKSKNDSNPTRPSFEKKEILPNALREGLTLKPGLEEKDGSEQVKNVEVVATMVHKINTSSVKGKDDGSSGTLVEEKAPCNYARGRWVVDNKRPLYSGFGCKRWLSEMWACRLTQRTDFSYESFRWQPENCEMPNFEESKFLRRMQDKTVAFVGDSLGRQQFQSLMCMVTGGKDRPDVIDVGKEYGLVKARHATRPEGWAYRFQSTNTTILYYWSASLCDLEPLNIKDPATDYAMHLDRPAAFLRRYLHRFDVLVLNTGHHWNRGKLRANRWIMHVGGVPNTNGKLATIGSAKNFTIYSVVKWLDLQLPKHPQLRSFFRTISPRHFFNGEWDSGGSCENTTPLAGGKEVLQEKSSDTVAEGAVKGTNVKLLDITALSKLRDEGHISKYSIKATPGVQDCLHWCLPGIPDTWNEILFAQL